MKPAHFVPTTLARRLLARLQATHERRRISIFSGPPGIGKTTAIEVFCERFHGQVAVVKVERPHAREVLVLQHMLEALRGISGVPVRHMTDSVWWMRSQIFETIELWKSKRGESDPRLTVVFDEAQNLSRKAMEALRYWNDEDRCYAPFPIGFAFVGNNEFSLKIDDAGKSAISAAVADRALYADAFEYSDLVDQDLSLFIQAHLEAEPTAVSMIVRHFRSTNSSRSLRRVGDLLCELQDMADGNPITESFAAEALSYLR